jgi:hypothetical protein
MLVLGGAILLMRMGAGDKEGDGKHVKDGIQSFILSTPIRLDDNNLSIKQTFN